MSGQGKKRNTILVMGCVAALVLLGSSVIAIVTSRVEAFPNVRKEPERVVKLLSDTAIGRGMVREPAPVYEENIPPAKDEATLMSGILYAYGAYVSVAQDGSSIDRLCYAGAMVTAIVNDKKMTDAQSKLVDDRFRGKTGSEYFRLSNLVIELSASKEELVTAYYVGREQGWRACAR